MRKTSAPRSYPRFFGAEKLGITLILLLAAAPARAAYEDLGAGARGPAMGNAFVPIADDVYAIYYNPAGLALLASPQFGASYTKYYSGLSDGSDLNTSFLGYAHPLSDGKQGTIGTAWNSFSLNSSLYRENSLYLSYARRYEDHKTTGDLYYGLSLKYLQSSFGSFDTASNAKNGLAYTGTADPLLQNKSQGAADADLGLLYRIGRHYTLGFAALHVLQPNVAFSSGEEDKLPMTLKFGFNYRSLVSNLVAQLDTARSPSGTQDKTFTLAAERWFASLLVGEFGLRGGLSLGSRDYKQFSVGASYRAKRMTVDYGFEFPINTVSRISGSHRVALTFRFGKPSEEEESQEMVLEAMRQLKSKAAAQRETEVLGLSPGQRTSLEEILAQSRALQVTARYKESLDAFSKALTIAPANKSLLDQYGRLNLVGQQIKALPEYRTDASQSALHGGILAFLAEKDVEAVQLVSEALRIKPDDKDIDRFLAQLELTTGVKRVSAAKPDAAQVALANLLTRADTAVQDGDYHGAIGLSLQVVKEDATNAGAWKNLGTSYFALKDYDASLKAWNKALDHEKDPDVRALIRGYVKSIGRARSRGPALAPPVAAKPEPARPKMTPQERSALFNEGVDHFTRREFPQAKKAFEEILKADPDNVEAQKALRRVKDELP